MQCFLYYYYSFPFLFPGKPRKSAGRRLSPYTNLQGLLGLVLAGVSLFCVLAILYRRYIRRRKDPVYECPHRSSATSDMDNDAFVVGPRSYFLRPRPLPQTDGDSDYGSVSDTSLVSDAEDDDNDIWGDSDICGDSDMSDGSDTSDDSDICGDSDMCDGTPTPTSDRTLFYHLTPVDIIDWSDEEDLEHYPDISGKLLLDWTDEEDD